MKRSAHALLLAVWGWLSLFNSEAQSQASMQDCKAVLDKDYYSVAEDRKLHDDYLNIVNEGTYNLFKNDARLGGKVFGISLEGGYQSFDEHRRQYLNKVHHIRNKEESRHYLEFATSTRAFESYDKCLAESNQPGLKVWASEVSPETIELKVRWVNFPSGTGHGNHDVGLVGTVQGGSVDGAPADRLWVGSKKWGIMQTRSFTIKRSEGATVTRVKVQPDNGSPSVELRFPNADATVQVGYQGYQDTLVGNVSNVARTEDVHEGFDAGRCVKKIDPDNRCAKRTVVVLKVDSGYVLKNVKTSCPTSPNCSHADDFDKVRMIDERTYDAHVDNWGPPRELVITGEKYERRQASSCHERGILPVLKGRQIVVEVEAECRSIAVVKWKDLRDQNEGQFRFGEQGDSFLTLVGSPLDNPGMASAVYGFGITALTSKGIDAPQSHRKVKRDAR